MNVIFFNWRLAPPPSPPAPPATAASSSTTTRLLDNDSSSSAAAGNSDVVIEIDDGGVGDSDSTCSSAEGPCCAVCMEPLEWVAVGPCGHAVVCSSCAARIRSSKNWQPDLRCCICRADCPFVVVTKASTAADGVIFPAGEPAANSRQVWWARGCYWYCAAMSAYFDDAQQYRATRAIARGQVKGGGAVVGNDGGGGRRTLSSCVDVFRFLLNAAIFALFGVLFGSVVSSLAAGRATPGGQVAFVSGCAAVSMLGSIFFYFA